jgi:hypothetical protein
MPRAFARQNLNDMQRKAVEDYLEQHRETNRDFAYDVELPACGRVSFLPAVGSRTSALAFTTRARADGTSAPSSGAVRAGTCLSVGPRQKTVAMNV